MTLGPAPRVQRLQSWIESYVELTDNQGAPEIFRRWAAIACVAGVMERKVWIKTSKGNLYPNLYTILVAPPGVGKSVALANVELFWREIKDLHVAPTSVTKASLMDALKDATRRIVQPAMIPPYVEFNSLLVLASELGVLVPGYENEFMNALTTLYDCGYYAERRRTNSLKFEMAAPQLNLVGATTPGYLQNLMPEGAWNQGFASRVIFVFAGTQVITDIFSEVETNDLLNQQLHRDLAVIFDRFGPITVDPAVQKTFMNWARAGGPPTPDHPRLEHYLTRRTTHLLKLCMVAAISRADGPWDQVHMVDYERAMNWLLEAEHYMPDIFRAMTGKVGAQDELWHFVFTLYAKTKKPIPEQKLVAFLRERVPSHEVMKTIEIMVRSGIFRVQQDLAQGGINFYEPAPKQPGA